MIILTFLWFIARFLAMNHTMLVTLRWCKYHCELGFAYQP